LPFSAEAVKQPLLPFSAGIMPVAECAPVSGPDAVGRNRCGHLAKGLYLLRIDAEHGRQVLKFVKL
jgi:hypothetical protein